MIVLLQVLKHLLGSHSRINFNLAEIIIAQRYLLFCVLHEIINHQLERKIENLTRDSLKFDVSVSGKDVQIILVLIYF